MRVTNNMFPEQLSSQLSILSSRQNRYQSEVATGKRLQSPEDDPAAMRRVLSLQIEAKSITQYRQTMTSLKEEANAALETIKGLKNVSDRAQEIAMRADNTRVNADLQSFASEITQLIQHSVQLANAKYRDDYQFAGTDTSEPPFELQQDADGRISGVVYHGNNSVNQTEIDVQNTITVKVPGVNDTGSGTRGLITDSRSGADFIKHLIDLQNHLLSGDIKAIADADRSNLSKDEENLLFHTAANAAMQARLDALSSLASERGTHVQNSVSDEVDADLATTMVQLSQAQYAYQAALQTGSVLLTKSLLDYLR